MKKAISLLTMVLVVAMYAFAITPADLAGYKWKAKKMDMPSPDESMHLASELELTFVNDTAANEKMDIIMSIYDRESKMKIDIFMKATCNATYTAAGDSITVTSDPSTSAIECEDDDIRITFPGGESNAIMESMIKNQMRQVVDMMRQQLLKEDKDKSTVYTDVVIKGKKATAQAHDMKFEFSIKKL